jgi:hypothetical protein
MALWETCELTDCTVVSLKDQEEEREEVWFIFLEGGEDRVRDAEKAKGRVLSYIYQFMLSFLLKNLILTTREWWGKRRGGSR